MDFHVIVVHAAFGVRDEVVRQKRRDALFADEELEGAVDTSGARWDLNLADDECLAADASCLSMSC